MLPEAVELVHGPGCPVCVTPLEKIDQAIEVASKDKVIFCSYGDMLRVPGSQKDLLTVKAEGGDVRFVYSPLEAVNLAKENPQKEIVFFAVGFETTAPANAMAAMYARQLGLTNFSLLVAQVLVPPAMEAILSSPKNRVQGFLAAGHVCTIMGLSQYRSICEKYKVPIVATGFEPVDILEGVWMCISQLEKGRWEVENQYVRSVRSQGNEEAQRAVREVFCISNRSWRGIGDIENSGLALSSNYADMDAEKKWKLTTQSVRENESCICGRILQGIAKPMDCPNFAKSCTPDTPLGATMVSEEGACSAYYKYRVHL
jgi:hydrogenase expression/formation protein HypD